MVGKVKVTVKGLKEVDRALKQIGPELAQQAGDSALRAMAKPIIAEARRIAPKRTGRYAENIAFQKNRKGDDDQRAGHIGVRAPWSRLAHLLEFGTAKMAAKPHLRPALDGQGENAVKEGGVVLARSLKNIVRKLERGNPVKKVR